MDIFNFLSLIGGLSLFLFGMNIMGQALERRAGDSLRMLLGKLTTNKAIGLLTGIGVTAIVQSSSATTVMVVGFVNSGLMTLRQAANVIMGANVGTTVTAWLLSLSGIESGNVFVKLLKASSFTPVLALIGIILYMFCKSDKKKNSGTVLLGFATLMVGMETMSAAVSGLSDVAGFRELFIMFKNPILGVLAGAVLTAIIQSSSASVGILQALAVTGQVSYGAAIPIIMGQNIGTCITAMLSSVGANKNAKRAALIHLLFNVIGAAVWLTVFYLIKVLVKPIILDYSASLFGIAVAHTIFNVLCTLLLLPMSGVLEIIVNKLVPNGKTADFKEKLDERLLATPSIALERSRYTTVDMANCAFAALNDSIEAILKYSTELDGKIRHNEEKTDRYEDMLGEYLVKLSMHQVTEDESGEIVKLLKIIGDFERISDHSVNLLEAAKEIKEKKLAFSTEADKELNVILGAIKEISYLTITAFTNNDINTAYDIEALEQVIDDTKERLRTKHILRLQRGACSIETGFVWSDLLTDIERISDHCANIAGCLTDTEHHNLNSHEFRRAWRKDGKEFKEKYEIYARKYSLV